MLNDQDNSQYNTTVGDEQFTNDSDELDLDSLDNDVDEIGFEDDVKSKGKLDVSPVDFGAFESKKTKKANLKEYHENDADFIGSDLDNKYAGEDFSDEEIEGFGKKLNYTDPVELSHLKKQLNKEKTGDGKHNYRLSPEEFNTLLGSDDEIIDEEDEFEPQGEYVDDEEPFEPQGGYTLGNAGGYLVQISDDGDSARVKYNDDEEVSDWLPIEYVENQDGEEDEDGLPMFEPVIDPEGLNIPLNMVMRLNRGVNTSKYKNESAEEPMYEMDEEALTEAIFSAITQVKEENEKQKVLNKLSESIVKDLKKKV